MVEIGVLETEIEISPKIAVSRPLFKFGRIPMPLLRTISTVRFDVYDSFLEGKEEHKLRMAVLYGHHPISQIFTIYVDTIERLIQSKFA